MGDYGNGKLGGNSRSINDEMSDRVGGAGPAYTNQDRDRPMMATSSTRSHQTIGDLAEQANTLNSRADMLLEQVRDLVDRMGAPFPPSSVAPADAKRDINGPIDYTAQHTAIAIEKLDDLSNLLVSIGSRI